MHDAAKQYLDDIAQRKRQLQGELKELRALEKALRAVGSATAKAKTATQHKTPGDTGPTLKKMIVAVLEERSYGADALEILDLIKGKFGQDVKRTSLSPQLSRLKKSEQLVLIDKVWCLPGQLPEEPTLEGALNGEPFTLEDLRREPARAPDTPAEPRVVAFGGDAWRR